MYARTKHCQYSLRSACTYGILITEHKYKYSNSNEQVAIYAKTELSAKKFFINWNNCKQKVGHFLLLFSEAFGNQRNPFVFTRQ